MTNLEGDLTWYQKSVQREPGRLDTAYDDTFGRLTEEEKEEWRNRVRESERTRRRLDSSEAPSIDLEIKRELDFIRQTTFYRRSPHFEDEESATRQLVGSVCYIARQTVKTVYRRIRKPSSGS